MRRFDHLYAREGKKVLVEPQPYLTEVPKILGLDGRKMSKSYGNAVELGEDPEQVALEFIDADESFVTGPETA